jgi:hypothetical protein
MSFAVSGSFWETRFSVEHIEYFINSVLQQRLSTNEFAVTPRSLQKMETRIFQNG